MLIVVVLLGICQIATMLGLGIGAKLYLDHKQKSLSDAVTEELSKLVKGEPCQSAAVLIAAGKVIGTEAGRSVKAGLMQNLSAAQHQINGAAYDASVEAISDKQPAIGNVLASIGQARGSKLLNNPLVQLAFQGLMGNLGKGAGVSEGNHSHESIRDRLKGKGG